MKVPVIYKTSFPSKPLPCFLSFQFTTMQSKATGTADHILPLGNLFSSSFWAAAPKGTKSCRTQGDFCSSVRSFVRSSVRSSVRPFVRPSVRPSVRSFVRPFVRSSVRSFVRPCGRVSSKIKIQLYYYILYILESAGQNLSNQIYPNLA